MITENTIDLTKLADTVREVRRDLYALATGPQLIGRYCVCGLEAQFCDTTCDPDNPKRCLGPVIRHAAKRLSDALL